MLAAIGRRQGATLDELTERHNVAKKTARNWLNRFADQSLEDAPYGDERSSQPTKLSNEEKDEIRADLQRSPKNPGTTARLVSSSGTSSSRGGVRRRILAPPRLPTAGGVGAYVLISSTATLPSGFGRRSGVPGHGSKNGVDRGRVDVRRGRSVLKVCWDRGTGSVQIRLTECGVTFST